MIQCHPLIESIYLTQHSTTLIFSDSNMCLPRIFSKICGSTADYSLLNCVLQRFCYSTFYLRTKDHRRLQEPINEFLHHITWFTSSVRRLSTFFRTNFKFEGGIAFLFLISYSDAANMSFSVTQHENSHLLLPHPVACTPPCSQHENESLHWCTTL